MLTKLKNISPNRVAIYLTLVSDVIAALLPILADLNVPQIVAVLTAVAAVNAKVLMFLKGTQTEDKAELQDLLAQRQQARDIETAQAIGGPNRVPGMKLPR